jgi:hypothetical protein
MVQKHKPKNALDKSQCGLRSSSKMEQTRLMGGGERYVMAPVADQLMQHKCCD